MSDARETIMVVDDTPANLKLLQEMLQSKGYRVLAAPSGKIALSAAARNPPDLILLDINMPDMDGFEVCRRLKADAALRDIPVIFISAVTETQDKVTAFATGGVDYVSKPFQFEEVHARVETHLRLRSMQREIEERRQAFLLTSMDGYCMADAKGRILEVNQTYCRLSGFSQEELLAMNLSDLEAGGQKLDISAWIREFAELGEGRFEALHRHRDGGVFDVEVSAKFLPDKGGRLILSLHDISGRKRSELQLRKNLAEKEALIAEIFHRTRNNMMVIMSILSFEEDLAKDGLVSAIVDRTNSRIQSMALVHERLLASQDLSSIDLGDYARDLISTLMQAKAFPGTRITMKISTETVPLLIDAAVPFGLLLHELLSNAFIHAFPGDRKGVVRVNIVRTPGGEIQLEVSDDGVGLPEDFDSRKAGKLGYQLIHGLVEQLGGILSLESAGGLACTARFKESHFKRRV
ncbi:MAG: response regulator [Rectinemataceae bacterium]